MRLVIPRVVASRVLRQRLRGRRAGLAALAALLVASAPSPADAHRPGRLHVAKRGAPAIVVSRGRQVLLRGVNTNQLGDFYRVNPHFRATIPLRKRDFAHMAHMGFDVVRLVISWSRIEPTPGVLNRRYLRRIKGAVRSAGRHGVYVVLDMHQDAWGKFIATPPNVTCPAGTRPNQGYDGAPSWATFTDGQSTCRQVGGTRSTPAVLRAWAGLWNDRNVIQGRLVETWRKLARAFAGNPAVVGYDPLNEPNPGDAKPLGDRAILEGFYRRAIGAIRAGESARRHGFHHIVFFEPSILFPGGNPTVHAAPRGFSHDHNLVFAPHLYPWSKRKPGHTGKRTLRRKFRIVRRMAHRYGAPVWLGEYGFFGPLRESKAEMRFFAERQDDARWGGAWWQWRKACGDPANYADAADLHPGHREIGNLLRTKCPSGKPLRAVGLTRQIVSRPYPLAAPGRLRLLRTSPRSAGFELRGFDWRNGGSPWLRLWIPDRGKRRPILSGHHVSKRSLRRVHGGWIATVHVRDRYRVSGGYPPKGARHHARHR